MSPALAFASIAISCLSDHVCFLAVAGLTVRETIEFAAKLRLPQSLGEETRAKRVDAILSAFGLLESAETLIGSEKKRGVSGGERKRAAVAVELVGEPRLLFLDEPTSGLDAANALLLVSALCRFTCERRMLVISSIHQPRSNIFTLFTSLQLLASGHAAYFGPVGNAIEYMSALTGETLPSQTNPADWLIDLLNADRTVAPARSAMDTAADAVSGTGGGSASQAVSFARPADTSAWWQFRVLLARSTRQQRGEVFNSVNVFQILSVAAIAAVIWSGSTSVRDLLGVLFFVNIQQAFNAQNTVLRLFPSERALLLRERKSAIYQMLPYFLAKSMGDLVAVVVLPVRAFVAIPPTLFALATRRTSATMRHSHCQRICPILPFGRCSMR